jgi:hypothetical protein
MRLFSQVLRYKKTYTLKDIGKYGRLFFGWDKGTEAPTFSRVGLLLDKLCNKHYTANCN